MRSANSDAVGPSFDIRPPSEDASSSVAADDTADAKRERVDLDDEVYGDGVDFVPGGDVVISMGDLEDLKEIFDEYEEAGGMEIDDFLKHFGAVARRRNRNMTDEDLALIFMRVDANANASVDWDEISTYLLMSTEKDVIRQNAKDSSRVYLRVPCEQDTSSIPELKLLGHHGSVRHAHVSPDGQRYFTHDDQTLKIWTAATLRHERTPHYSRAAITAVTMTPQWQNTVGVACMDTTLSFYDLETGELNKAFIGQRRGLIAHTVVARRQGGGNKISRDAALRAAAAMYRTIRRPAYTVGLNRSDQKRLHFGDRGTTAGAAAGSVDVSVPLLKHFVKDREIEATVLYDLGWDTRNATATSPATWCGFPTAFDIVRTNNGLHDSERLFVGLKSGAIQVYPLDELTKDGRALPPVGLNCLNFIDAHDDWISKLRYIPTLDSIITSSWDHTLQVRHLERLNERPTVLGSGKIDTGSSAALWNAMTHGHSRRVSTFDYHASLKVIASCAAGERDVLVWSPYITRPLSKLEGAKGHLLDLHFCQNDVHLVTITDDAVVKLWDLRTYRCITTMNSKKQAAIRASAHDDGPTFQCIAYDEHSDAIVTAARMPLKWPATRNDEVDRFFTGHRKPVIALTIASQFGQLITVDPTAVAVWDAFTGTSVMRWELDPSVGSSFVDATVDFHQRRLFAALANGTVLCYNYINAFVLKRCLPPGVADAEFEELLSRLPDTNVNEADAKARHDLMKQQLLNRPRFFGSRAPKRTVIHPSWVGSGGKNTTPLATSCTFAMQVRPRHIFAVVTGTDAGKAAIHIDEDGGERKPQRVISLGGNCFGCVSLPSSLLAFALDCGVSGYSLEEVGTKAQVFTPLPPLGPDDAYMCAVFEGELEFDPEVVLTTNEVDREDSFTTPQGLGDSGSLPPSAVHHRRSSAGLHAMTAARRASLTAYHKAHNHSAGSPRAAATTTSNTTANSDGTAASAQTGDASPLQLRAAQRSVSGISECIIPLHVNRHKTMVVTGTADGLVHFWCVRSQREELRFRASTARGDGVYCMAIDSTHNMLATGDHNGYVTIFDVTRVGTLQYDGAPVEAVVFLTKRWRPHASGLSAITFVETVAVGASAGNTPTKDGSTPIATQPTIKSVYGVDVLILTTSADCRVVMWTLDAVQVRSLGENGVGPAPQLPHAPAALATIDIARTNELYAFIEEYEGCTLDDIFDEMLGEGHPFHSAHDNDADHIDDDDDDGAPGSNPFASNLRSHPGSFDIATPVAARRRQSNATTSVTTTVSAHDDDMADSGPRQTTPRAKRDHHHSSGPASRIGSGDGSSTAALTTPLPASIAARNAALGVEAQRQALLEKKKAWTGSTRRAFAPGTYADLHVGHAIRRVLREMSRAGPNQHPCIIHHSKSFYIRTEEHTKRTVAAAAACHSPLTRGPSSGSKANLTPSQNSFCKNNATASVPFDAEGDMTMRFGRTALQSQMADFANSGVVLNATVTSEFQRSANMDSFVDTIVPPRHVAAFGKTPRIVSSLASDDAVISDLGSTVHTTQSTRGMRLVGLKAKSSEEGATQKGQQTVDLSRKLDTLSLDVVDRARKTDPSETVLFVAPGAAEPGKREARPPPTRQQQSRDTWKFLTDYKKWHETPTADDATPRGTTAPTTPRGTATPSVGQSPRITTGSLTARDPPRIYRDLTRCCTDTTVRGFKSLMLEGVHQQWPAETDGTTTPTSTIRADSVSQRSAGRGVSPPLLPALRGASVTPSHVPRPPPASRGGLTRTATFAEFEPSSDAADKLNQSGRELQQSMSGPAPLLRSSTFISRRSAATSKVRKRLQAEACGSDVVSMALRRALDEREVAIADLKIMSLYNQRNPESDGSSDLYRVLSQPSLSAARTASSIALRPRRGATPTPGDLLEGLGDDDLFETLDRVVTRSHAKAARAGAEPTFFRDRDDDEDDALRSTSADTEEVSVGHRDADVDSESVEDDGPLRRASATIRGVSDPHSGSGATRGAPQPPNAPADTAVRRRARNARQRRRRSPNRGASVRVLRDHVDSRSKSRSPVAPMTLSVVELSQLEARVDVAISGRSAANVFVDRLVRSIENSSAAIAAQSGAAPSSPSPARRHASPTEGPRRRSDIIHSVVERATEISKELSANLEMLNSRRNGGGGGDADDEEWERDSLMSQDERAQLHAERQLARAAEAAAREKQATNGVKATHGMLWIAQTHSRLKLVPPSDPTASTYYAPPHPIFADRGARYAAQMTNSSAATAFGSGAPVGRRVGTAGAPPGPVK